MKKIYLLSLSALVALSTFTGCKKDDDEEPKPKTKTELLTGPNWRVTAHVIQNATGQTQDVFANDYEPCDKDDFIKFNADKILRLNQGVTRCVTNTPQSENLVWDITSDNAILLILEDSGSSFASLYNIVELSDTKLQISQKGTLNGAQVTATITYTAF